MDLAAVASALADTINTNTGLTTFDYVPDAPAGTTAFGFVNLNTVTEDTYGFETMAVLFDFVVLVPRTTDRGGQRNLYELVATTGTRSVWRALADGIGVDGITVEIVEYRALGFEELAALGVNLGGSFSIRIIG